MNNNPLEVNEFRLFLNFKDLELGFGLVEITEPIGFDASTFGITQDSDRYGRDVEYGNVDIELEFQDVKTQLAENAITLPNGVVIDRLTMGLDFLLYAIGLKGYETEVEFIIRRNDIDFTIGVLDLASDMQTDMTTYLSCKVIQNTDKALIKRRSDLKVDLFSNVDLDGAIVNEVPTYSILLKAKPTYQISEWENDKTYEFYDSDFPLGLQTFFNAGTILKRFEVENSYAVFTPSIKTDTSGLELQDNFKAIIPTTTLTNIKVSLEIDATFEMTQGGASGAGRIFLGFNISDNLGDVIELFTYYFDDWGPFEPNFTITLNQTYTQNVEILYPGQILTAYCNIFGNADCSVKATVRKWKLKIEASSTHIDSITKGVRHIDLIKGTAERLGQFNVVAPRYDIGGEFYNNFVFNGFMIRQFLDKNEDGETIQTLRPFYNTWKDTTEQFKELNSDWHVLKDKEIYIGSYKDFYSNIDIGGFVQQIDDNYTLEFNERYQLQGFNYKYQDYEQDRSEQGTLDAVHTEAEFMIPNKQVEGVLTVEVPYTRDPFRIESTRRLNFRSDSTTSTSEDDRNFIIDCIEAPEGLTNTIQRVLSFSISNDPPTMKILADENFNWLLLGFQVNDPLYLVSFKFDGVSYGFTGLDVLSIEPSLLTLGYEIDFQEEILGSHTTFMTLEYLYTDLDYIMRTSEGFEQIENVTEPNTYGNLAYSIRRNMKHWESFIHTSAFYNKDKVFKNTYWKSNGELVTRLELEENPVKENENVLVNSLDEPILTPVLHNTTIIAGYEQVLELIDKMNEINDDNTIGGFVRVKVENDKLVKGYIKSLEYTWATQVLELTIEQKYESEYTEILRLGESLIQINQVGYDASIVKPLEYKANGNFVQLFDKRGIPLNNPYHYSKYKVAGDTFNNVIALTKAIDEIW